MPRLESNLRPVAKQYYHRNGPSELTLTGSLKGWTVLDRLKDIEAPTLV
jgi:L-proline amide hydrolase